MPGDEAMAGSVRIERRGGVAGLKTVAEHDLDTLASTQRSALDRVMRAPPAPPVAPTRGLPSPADRYTYRITVTDRDGAARSRDVAEAEMPAALERLSRPPGT